MTAEEILAFLAGAPSVRDAVVLKLNEGKVIRTEDEEAKFLARHLENNLTTALRNTDQFGKEISARQKELWADLDTKIKEVFHVEKNAGETTTAYAERAAGSFKESYKTDNARVTALEADKLTLAEKAKTLEDQINGLNTTMLEKDFDGGFQGFINGKKIAGIPDANQPDELQAIREVFGTRYRTERGKNGKLRFFKGDKIQTDKDANPLGVSELLQRDFGYKFTAPTITPTGSGVDPSGFSATKSLTRDEIHAKIAEKGYEPMSQEAVAYAKTLEVQ